jgi:1,4-alpha-glucan branching enzyme
LGILESAAAVSLQASTPTLDGGLRVYEAHVGMAQRGLESRDVQRVRRQRSSAIKSLGYNAIQLMAIQEHPYYGSFGYHVRSFFAPSSRFGTPEELKRLIDTAHGLGIGRDGPGSLARGEEYAGGIGPFDGTDLPYFHAGAERHAPAWDRCSSIIRSTRCSGSCPPTAATGSRSFTSTAFRFDGVTSMIYLDHGLGQSFSSYDDYFGATSTATPLRIFSSRTTCCTRSSRT